MTQQTATILVIWAISSCVPLPQVPSGVLVPPPGQRLQAVQGPMPGFGTFSTYSDALLAACPLILGLPNAVAGRETDQDFKLRWELSQEYCAWVYYTPDGKYEMSMLAASSVQDHQSRRQCALPNDVSDTRYSADKLGYVFVLHNHPYPRTLSRNDIGFIVEQGRIHGLNVRTHQGRFPSASWRSTRTPSMLVVTVFTNTHPSLVKF